MDFSMRLAVLSNIIIFCVVSIFVSSAPVRAQNCDEECFIIKNTFGQETLKRFLKSFPNSTHVDEAKQRLEYLDKIDSKRAAEAGYPAPTIKETTKIPASQAPTNMLGR